MSLPEGGKSLTMCIIVSAQ